MRLMTSVVWLALCGAVIGLAACGDDDGNTDGDAGTDDYQFKPLFECPASANEPADLLIYKDYPVDEEVDAFFDMVWGTAMAWVPESCIVDCTPTPPDIECKEASCTTDAGVTVEYSWRDTGIYDPDGPDAGVYLASSSTETVSVTLPEGSEAWNSLSASRELTLVVDSFMSEAWLPSRDHSASWTGTLLPQLPPDSSVVSNDVTGLPDDSCTMEAASVMWSHTGCTIDYRINECDWGDYYASCGYGLKSSIDVDNGTNKVGVDITHGIDIDDTGGCGYFGFVDDECVGEIDPDSWEVIGPCP
jgi:hypothetical protein